MKASTPARRTSRRSISKIKAAGADYLYWGGLHTEGGLIVRQMRDQGLKTVMVSGDGITTDEFATIGGPGVEGTLMTFPPDPQKRPEAAAVPSARSSKRKQVQARGLHPVQLRRRTDHG